jgi:ABC-type multidrug transport system fused ATPase/permease subunit
VIDGAPIDRVPLTRLRSALAIIPQEPTLFAGTIRSNLAAGSNGGVSDAELFSALRSCHLDAVLREHHQLQQEAPPPASAASTPSLAQCLDMEVKEKGLNYSVGQRQLICLCRAILQRARIVCVDEATASLDSVTDKIVRRTIGAAFRDSTLIVIAHRMSSVLELCTRAIVLSEGRVVEEGDPRVLLSDSSSHLHALSQEEGAGAAAT